MKILLVEDRGIVSLPLAGFLEDHGHEILIAYGCNDAKSLWHDADCLIVDLNLPVEGLDAEERIQSMNGVLAGWVWLKNHVLTVKPDIAKRTIIFSDYVSNLWQAVPRTELAGISVIRKRNGDSTDLLIRRVTEIASSLSCE